MPSDTAKRDETGGSHDPAVKIYRPQDTAAPAPEAMGRTAEVGGRRDGTEPTRFGLWNVHGGVEYLRLVADRTRGFGENQIVGSLGIGFSY